MKKIFAIILAAAMLFSLIPSAFAVEGDARENIVVNFACRANGEPSVAINHDKASIKPAAISGANFTSVAAETSTAGAASNQTRNSALGVAGYDGVTMLQVVLDATVWNRKAYVERYTANAKGRWTIEVDAGTTSAGWYDLTIRGTDHFLGAVWEVWADRAYVGDYNCRSEKNVGAGEHLTVNLGKVYISPDANGKFRLAFVLKEQGYTSATDKTPCTTEARILLEDITFAPCDAPAAAERKTISTELTWDTTWYTDTASDFTSWITHGFEGVPEKSNAYRNRYTAITMDNVEFFLQLCVRHTFPMYINQKITFKVKVPQAGYYYPEILGVLNSGASYVAIYVNDEYAGDYNFHTTQDGFVSGESKKLNALYIPAGEAEITFCPRIKNETSGYSFFIPYTIDLVPTENADIADVESQIPQKLEAGETVDLTAKVKMKDNSYRSFGYRLDAGEVYAKNTVKVESSDPSVVEVTKVKCVDEIDKSVIGGTGTPETIDFTLSAKSAGKANIKVTAVAGDKTFVKTYKVTVPANIPGEELSGNVSVYIDALSGGSVEKSTSTAIASVAAGTAISAKATANEGYVFSHWKDASDKFISSDAEYSIKPYVNTSLIAVFDKLTASDGEEKTVRFFNGNGDYVAERATAGASISDMPTATLAGYVFDMWTQDGKTEFDGNNITKAVTSVVAKYEDEGKTYSGKVTFGAEEYDVVYDKEVTFSDATAKAWKRNGKTVAYGTSYKHYIFDAAVITAETNDVEKLPVIVLGKHSTEDIYMIEYDVPEGFTKLEAGILFGDDGHKTVQSCYYKAKSSNKEENANHGQFTATKSADSSNAQSVVRGYLIYTDGTFVNVVYADMN